MKAREVLIWEFCLGKSVKSAEIAEALKIPRSSTVYLVSLLLDRKCLLRDSREGPCGHLPAWKYTSNTLRHPNDKFEKNIVVVTQEIRKIAAVSTLAVASHPANTYICAPLIPTGKEEFHE